MYKIKSALKLMKTKVLKALPFVGPMAASGCYQASVFQTGGGYLDDYDVTRTFSEVG